jgi:hypothetical protein
MNQHYDDVPQWFWNALFFLSGVGLVTTAAVVVAVAKWFFNHISFN